MAAFDIPGKAIRSMLVAGSGLPLSDHGTRHLQGVPGEGALFRSTPGPGKGCVQALGGTDGFGHSYGATTILSVLDQLPTLSGVLLYEPPFATPGNVPIPLELLQRWEELMSEDAREAVLISFYQDTLLFDDASLARVRTLPVWPARIAAVHTIIREGYAVNNFVPASARPRTGVRFLLGDATAPFLRASTLAASQAVEGSELGVLPGQGHVAIDTAPELIAQNVREVCAS